MSPELTDRNRRIVDLARDHVRPAVIAALVGVHPNTIYVILSKARDSDASVPIFRTGPAPRQPKATERWTARLPYSLYEALLPHAARRAVSVNALLQILIDAIVDDGLVNAILDDGEELRPDATKARDASPRNGTSRTEPAFPAVNTPSSI